MFQTLSIHGKSIQDGKFITKRPKSKYCNQHLTTQQEINNALKSGAAQNYTFIACSDNGMTATIAGEYLPIIMKSPDITD